MAESIRSISLKKNPLALGKKKKKKHHCNRMYNLPLFNCKCGKKKELKSSVYLIKKMEFFDHLMWGCFREFLGRCNSAVVRGQPGANVPENQLGSSEEPSCLCNLVSTLTKSLARRHDSGRQTKVGFGRVSYRAGNCKKVLNLSRQHPPELTCTGRGPDGGVPKP